MSHWRDAFCLAKTDLLIPTIRLKVVARSIISFDKTKQPVVIPYPHPFCVLIVPFRFPDSRNMTGPLATATSDYSWKHWMTDQLNIIITHPCLHSSPAPLPGISSYLSSSRRAICFTFLLHAAEVFLPYLVASLNHRVVWDAIGSNKMTHPRELTAAWEETKLFPVTVSARSPHTSLSACLPANVNQRCTISSAT